MKKYAEYKDSGVAWIGHIPSHWGIRRLRHLGIARNGLTYSPEDIVDEGIKVLRSSNIQNNALNFNDTVFIQMRVPSNLVLKEGDLLICSRNGSRELIGKCALIDKETEGNTYGAFMCVFRSKYNRFIQKVFQGDVFDYYLATFTTATINQLTNSNLYNIQIPFPPDKEQEAIVEYLDHGTQQIDTLLADLQSQAEMLDRYKRELIAEAVTKGLNKSARMKDSGVDWIGEIPVHWELIKARWVFKQRNSKGNENEVLLSATQKFGMFPQDEIEGTVKVKADTNLQLFKTVHKNDFVISLRSFQGGFEISDYEGVCSPAYQVFYNATPICHRFYKWLFKSIPFIDKMNSITTGIREGRNIPYEAFAQCQIPVPPITEQEDIAQHLDKRLTLIDGLIADINEQIEKLKQYRQIVIHDAVTGKIKVTEG